MACNSGYRQTNVVWSVEASEPVLKPFSQLVPLRFSVEVELAPLHNELLAMQRWPQMNVIREPVDSSVELVSIIPLIPFRSQC